MKTFRPGLIIILVCCFLVTIKINSGHKTVFFATTFSDDDQNPQFDKMAYILGNSYVPRGVSEVLQTSHQKFIEGCDLISAGDSEEARDCFNEAIDLLLSPNWDMASTLHLNHYFQELIQRIPKDTSLNHTGFDENFDDCSLIPLNIRASLEREFIVPLDGTSYGIPITINKIVAKSLYYWLNDGRRFFVEGMLRSGQYRPIIERIFREESIPLDLMYLAQVESLFKPTAFSKARAKGIWQFNKNTAIQYGLRVTHDIDERSDPEKSTRAAAQYLKDLYYAFQDWDLALAAYNWGGSRVHRLIQRTGIHDFWELVESGQRLPKETKNHIPLIHASIILARNPEIFGFPIELDRPIEYVEVSVSRPIDLRDAAEVLGTTVDTLKMLNPALTRLRTPAGYPGFRLKVPADSDVRLRERLVALSAITQPPLEHVGRQNISPEEAIIQIAAK